MPHIGARVSGVEHQAIQGLARKAGLSVSGYLRARALDRLIRPPRPLVEGELVRQLTRLGNNLNQLTRLAHERALPDSVSLAALLRELTQKIDPLASRLAELNEP